MPRSPLLMNADDTALLVVDVQQRLLPVIHGGDQLAVTIERLLSGAEALDLPRVATEQRPDKLGPTIPALGQRLPDPPSKTMFSCRGCDTLTTAWRDRGITRVLLTGIETHVCVQQTALDLLADGFWVYVAVDAVGSRHAGDHQTALRRMESAGVTLTTAESALFEWCEDAQNDAFRTISGLAKQR